MWGAMFDGLVILGVGIVLAIWLRRIDYELQRANYILGVINRKISARGSEQ